MCRPFRFGPWLLSALPLLLAACASGPPVPTGPAGSTVVVCHGPDCCRDPLSLAFEPHRLNCESLARRAQGEHEQAWKLLNEAIAAARAAESANEEPAREVLCYTLNDAGHGHGRRGDIDAARAAFDGNLAACRARFGEASKETAQAAYSRANFRLGTGDVSTGVAEDLDIAIHIAQTLNLQGLRAIALDASGRLADLQGRHADGDRLLREALEIKRTAFGEQSVEFGTTLTNLGANAIDRGDMAQGATWYQAAMDAYRADPGPDSDRYLGVASGLASTWLAMEEYEKAGPLYEELVEATGRVFGVDDERHVTLLNDHAVLRFRQGDAARAQTLFAAALEVRRRTRPDAINTAWTAFNTAQASLTAGGCDAALPYGRTAQEILDRVAADTAQAERDELTASLGEFRKACPSR